MRNLVRRLSGIPGKILPFPWLQRVAPGAPVFPFYHMVSDDPAPHVANLYPVTSVSGFVKDLDFLLRHYRPLRYSEVKKYASDDLSGRTDHGFFLSFDDGLREMAEIVAPILIKKGIEASFFVNPAFTGNRMLFYRHKASLLAGKIGSPENDTLAKKCASVLHCKTADIRELILSSKQNDVLFDRLAQLAEVDFDRFLSENKPYMELSQLCDLRDKGFIIGVHGYDHTPFASLTETGMKEQLTKSIEWLTGNLAVRELTFAFPFTDDAVPYGFFRWMYEEAGIEVSFGTAGMKHEKLKLLAAKPTRNPIPYRTFLVSCSLTPWQSQRGMRSPEFNRHIQRIAMEKRNFTSARQIMEEEYGYYALRSIFGKNKITRR